MVSLQPKVAAYDESVITDFEKLKEVIAGVRTIRLQKNVPNKEQLELQIVGENDSIYNSVVAKMCNLSAINIVSEKSAGSISFLVGTAEYAVPMLNLINVDEEIAKMQNELISEKDLQKLQNKFESNYVSNNASVEGIADNLATYYMLYGDINLINTEIDIYRSITRFTPSLALYYQWFHASLNNITI
jgi:valyl-tRNA synthetase